MSSDSRIQFPSGAVRSSDAESVRYDLITPIGLRRLAETCAEGAQKYGDHNWQKGIPANREICVELTQRQKAQKRWVETKNAGRRSLGVRR